MPSVRDFAELWLEKNAVIIDTETTGLDDLAQVVEVSAIDCLGNVLLDTLVRPWSPPFVALPNNFKLIPEQATAIHGITDEMVLDAPSWSDVHARLSVLVQNRPVVIYNSAYDVRLLIQTAELVGLGDPLQWAASIDCGMLAYAEHRGVWNPRRQSYKWHKLTDAVAHEGIDVSGMTAHRALGDCQMTLELIKAMAGQAGVAA